MGNVLYQFDIYTVNEIMDTILFIVTANYFDVNQVHLYYGSVQPVLNRLTTLEAQTKPFDACFSLNIVHLHCVATLSLISVLNMLKRQIVIPSQCMNRN